MRWHVNHHSKLVWGEHADGRQFMTPRRALGVTSFAHMGEDLLAMLLQHDLTDGTVERGYGWAVELLDEIEGLPEVRALRSFAADDPLFAVIGAQEVMDALYDALPATADAIPVESDVRAEMELAATQAVVGNVAVIGSQDPEPAIRRAESASQAFSQSIGAIMPSLRQAAREAALRARERIAEMEDMENVFGAGGVGRQSSTGASRGSSKERMALAKRVGRHGKLRRIVELGRLFCVAADRAQSTKSEHAQDEAVGLTLGDEIRDAVPEEVYGAFAQDDCQRLLFYSRYVERALVQVKRSGVEPMNRGPVVYLLDSSGSMAGQREEWGKAVALALWRIARQQKRDFVVMEYDTVTRTVFIDRDEDRQSGKGVDTETVIEWMLSEAAGGGTEIVQGLLNVLALIEMEYPKADLIMVNDGDIIYSESWLEQYQERKRRLGVRAVGVALFCDSRLLAPLVDRLCEVKDLHGSEFAEVVFDF